MRYLIKHSRISLKEMMIVFLYKNNKIQKKKDQFLVYVENKRDGIFFLLFYYSSIYEKVASQKRYNMNRTGLSASGWIF